MGTGENAVTSIFSFSHNVSTLSKIEIIILDNFILLSANAFNLDQSQILSFGIELTLYNTMWSCNDH